jgi:hypothetical protein
MIGLTWQYRWLSLYVHSLSAFCISAGLFQCREHQYPIRCKILKPIIRVETSPGLSENVMQMISLATKNFGISLTSKWQFLYVSRFTRFPYTRRFTGTQPPCIPRVTYTARPRFTMKDCEIFRCFFQQFCGLYPASHVWQRKVPQIVMFTGRMSVIFHFYSICNNLVCFRCL